jgi:integrase
MRDLYVRHRPRCRFAKPDYKDPKGRPARQIFSCGCPIYARYEIRDLASGTILEKYNGSLKGIHTKEAAEEYLDLRFSNVRAGQIRASEKALTVAEAVERFIEEKKSSLPPPPPVHVSEHVTRFHRRLGKDPNDREREIIVKYRTLLGALVTFCDERGVKHVTEIKYEHLVDFQQTWRGRKITDPATKEERYQEQSQSTKQKNQEFLRAFFRRAVVLGWIQVNPAERLLSIKVPKPQPKPFTDEQRHKLLDLIPTVHPNHADMVRAFLYVQIFGAPRIADVVQLEVGDLADDGIMIRQQKTDEPVFVSLPPFVVDALRKLTPKSDRYFFWSGNGQAESAAKHWSGELLKLYRAAGIPSGQRSHEWRDTLATKILSDEAGRMEDAQLALGHENLRTTEKYYAGLARARYEAANKIKQKIWEKEGLLD